MKRILIALVLALGVLGAPSGGSHARDLTGRLGLGGHVDSGPLGPALSAKYWVSDLGLQALFAFSARHSTEDAPGVVELRPGARLLYAMTRARATNLYTGVGVSSVFRKSKVDGGQAVYLDLVLGAEHFFGERLSIAGQVTVSIELGKDPTRSMDSAAWGGSFHYYF